MNFPEYDNRRDSGVEWLEKIPGHWNVVRLGALFRESGETGEAGLPILSVSIHDGVSDKELSEDELDRKVTRSEDIAKYKRVVPGDLVYNMMRAWQGGFGTVSVDGLVSPAYVVARPIAQLLTKFVEHLLRTPHAVEEMRRRSHGVTDFRLRLYWDEFKSMRVALPPLDEQEAILLFLDRETVKIDALVAEQEKLIELLKEKHQAVISHAFTKGLNPDAPMKGSGVEWLGEVPAHWEVSRLRYLCDIQTGSRDTENAEPEGEYPFFVRSQTVERINTYAFDGEAVLTAGDGAGVGKVFHHFIGKFDFHQRVYALSNFRSVTGRFVFFYLRENFRKVVLEGAAKSTVDSLRMPMFLNFPVTVPPLNEQEAILEQAVLFETSNEALIGAAQRAIDLLKEHRSALISAVVTGKIDVRGLSEVEIGEARKRA